MLPFEPGTARTDAAGDLLRDRDEILAEVRQHLLQAQQLSKKYYDNNHREAEYAVGDWVWLRLLHRTAQPWTRMRSASWGLATQDPFRCSSALARSPTAFSCRPARASTTCFM